MTKEQIIENYITGGKAIFTIVIKSDVSDKEQAQRYTYKVTQAYYDPKIFYVSVLYGSENTKDYRFLGFFNFDDFKLKSSKKAKVASEDRRFVVFDEFLYQVGCKGNLSEKYEFYHSGRCARCGRLLTTPESIAIGFGPECLKRGDE